MFSCNLRQHLSQIVLLSACFCIGEAALAQANTGDASGDKRIAIARIETAPVIDGLLDDPVWSTIEPFGDLHQINPVEYAEPSERTEIRLAYDSDTLYVSARLWDSQPDRITAQVLRQGEALGSEDRFAIIIDPHLDRRSGYRFQVNPNGVRWDALYSDTSDLESNWEGIWRGVASRDGEGWSAEIAIPFKTLSFDPNSDAWGINFERTIQRNDETLAWVSRNRQLNPGIAGTVVGFSGLEQGKGLDIVPSVSAVGRQIYGPMASSSSDLEPSLDIFYKFTPSLGGALTFNTDFSATEVDDRQVNLSRFGLFFPEKRDFFLQDADIFEFGRIDGGGGNNFGGFGGGGGGGGGQNGMPFFSRRIGLSSTGQPVDLNIGGKLTGRAGRLNVGALAVNQDGFEDVEESDIFVGRLSANILGESNAGFVFTEGDPLSNLDARTFGTDFNYRNTRLRGNKVLEANAWAQETDNEGIVGDNNAYGFGISSPNNTGWRGGVSGRQIETNFDPKVGFVNESGIRNLQGNLDYRWRFAENYIRQINIGGNSRRTDRLDTGNLDRRSTEVGFNIGNRYQDQLFVNLNDNREIIPFDFPIYVPSDGGPPVIIPAGDYQWQGIFMGLRTGNQRKVSVFLGAGTGEYYDGESSNINTNIEWRPSRNLRLQGGYSYRDVDLPGGSFTVRSTSFTAQYVFSSTLSWINLIQYDNFSEVVGFNSRLHWIPEAGREGYIVFNHNLADPEKNDSFHSTSADVAVKFSYTWRF